MLNKQNIKMFLLIALAVVGMMLWNSWQQKQTENESKQISKQEDIINKNNINLADKEKSDLPEISNSINHNAVEERKFNLLPEKDLISISTDVIKAKINPKGGDLVYLELLEYPGELKSEQGFVLFDTKKDRYYLAESGLLSQHGPDSSELGKGEYKFNNKNILLSPDKNEVFVDLFYKTKTNVDITKRYVFKKGKYLINVKYLIKNNGDVSYTANMFGRLKRNEPVEKNSGFMGAMRTYTGAAVNTPEVKYKKLAFSDMKKEPFKEDIVGGWAALVEHYFTSAWIPLDTNKHNYSSEVFANDIFGVRFVSEQVTVKPGESKEISANLFAGPEVGSLLKQASSGLELTIDYGPLWWLCQPIFWVLKTIFNLVGNWGLAIILTTVFIKALFYKLSAASYRSMGNMRKLQPQIENLKSRCGEDKQKFGQEMMALYKKEKINPLGGCLPILVQIPVFISLYYVLLESVELRQSPFMFWIVDLSVKDPYYVLPLIMGATMFLQQKMNPAPPDPVQAKVMAFMPVMFTFLFLQFPSGLVLYWVVNNCLSILQQWYITKNIK